MNFVVEWTTLDGERIAGKFEQMFKGFNSVWEAKEAWLDAWTENGLGMYDLEGHTITNFLIMEVF